MNLHSVFVDFGLAQSLFTGIIINSCRPNVQFGRCILIPHGFRALTFNGPRGLRFC
jgi:hypothetical protein